MDTFIIVLAILLLTAVVGMYGWKITGALKELNRTFKGKSKKNR